MNTPPFSRIIAGTMTWGVWGKNLNERQMIDLMHCCLENGISTFDHADIYGGYTTEAAFGTAFTSSNIDRETIQLISKCGIQHLSNNRDNTVKHYDYSKKYIIWSAEQSLRNLQTEYLDLLLLHRPSPLMQTDEIAEAVIYLKKEGMIRDFGVSNFTTSQTDLIRMKTAVNFNQIQFSVTDLDAMLDGGLDHMQLHNIRPMAWNPLGSVFRNDQEKSMRVSAQATRIAAKHNVSLDLILLAWIVKHPAQIIPVCGTTDVDRISKLMQATKIELSLEDWFSLWEASIGNKVP
ncbi:MAG: aldo/keto reductase [Flavobacterium sp.]|nr:aldo/keto reductase [Flavobacterium sp.]